MAEERDIWQAASLLVGLYGDSAPEYAVARMRLLEQEAQAREFETWSRIVTKIHQLLEDAQGPALH